MKIILMRHGDALIAEIDSARPLSEKGVNEAQAAGNLLRSINEIPDVILHSPLLRSKETAEIVEKMLERSGLSRLYKGLKPDDKAWEFLSDVLEEYAPHVDSGYTVMAVGHEPFMSGLTSLLLRNDRFYLPFSTGTLLEACGKSHKEAWNLCFYINLSNLANKNMQ